MRKEVKNQISRRFHFLSSCHKRTFFNTHSDEKKRQGEGEHKERGREGMKREVVRAGEGRKR